MKTQQQAAKQVKIIARIAYKRNPKAVKYIVRSSNGVDQYETTIYNGKATGCTCPATKPCYHMNQLEAKEQQRSEATQAVAQAEQIVADAQADVRAARFAELFAKYDYRQAEKAAKASARSSSWLIDLPAPPEVPSSWVESVPLAERGVLNGHQGFSLLR